MSATTPTTTPTDRTESGELRDWEAPGRLLRRYLEAAGMQTVGFVLCAIGFIVLTYGWWKISKESIVALQIPYLVSGGIGGALLLGMGGVLLLTHELRLDNRRLEAVEEALNELRDVLLLEAEKGADDTRADAARNGHGATAMAAATADYLVVAGGTRYHSPTCAVTAGKDVDHIDAATIEDRGLQPCKLCSPA